MSGLRVISGKVRGYRLRSVPGDIARPVTDRTKESLFNIVGADIQGATLLDLFAGTGSVGIEALSRGAKYVRFIDNHNAAIKTIKSNLKHTDLSKDADVIRMDAFKYLKQTSDVQFDYIYVAPPQYKGIWKRAITSIRANPNWLSGDAWIIVQIDPVEYEQFSGTCFEEFDKRTYGSTMLIFLREPLKTTQ